MTTIIADFRSRTMIADTLISNGSQSYRSQKMWRLKNGEIYGFAGNVESGIALRDWLNGNRDPAKKPDNSDDVDALLLTPTGIQHWGTRGICIPIDDDSYSVGSGSAFALGALRAGATPMKAMEIAAELDRATGGPFVELRLEENVSVRRKALPRKRARD